MNDDPLVIVSSRPDPRPVPADPSKIAPRVCRGLEVTASSITWVDSLGHAHDLLRERRLSPGDVARQMQHSTKWVLRRVRCGDIYPVIRWNPRLVEIFACAIPDYVARGLRGTEGAR